MTSTYWFTAAAFLAAASCAAANDIAPPTNDTRITRDSGNPRSIRVVLPAPWEPVTTSADTKAEK